MATFTAINTAKYGTAAKTSLEWQHHFHDTEGLSYREALCQWKVRFGAGDFVACSGTKAVKAIAKKLNKPVVNVKINDLPDEGDLTVAPVVHKGSRKADFTTVGKNTLPPSGYKKIDYKVSDPDDPHHYEFVKEAFDTEKERDDKIAYIKKNPLLFYISKGWGDKKFDVAYWRQID